MYSYEKGLALTTERIQEYFGNPDEYELHELPIEKLEAMKNWFSVQMTYLSAQKIKRFETWNTAKTALKTLLTEKKIEHLKTLNGSEKARIATMYAENDCAAEIRGVVILENEYNEIKEKLHAVEKFHISLMQTIKVTLGEVERQQFIKGG